MPEISPPSQQMKLPHNERSVAFIRSLSFIGAVVLLVIGCLMLIGWTLQTVHILQLPPTYLLNLPLSLGLIVCSLTLLFQNEFPKFPFIPVVGGVFLSGIGIFVLYTTFFHNSPVTQDLLNLSSLSGLTFSFLGVALVLSHSKLPHPFHSTQLFIMLVLFINTFKFLDTLYRFSSALIQPEVWSSLFVTIVLVIACQSVLFSKPNRGFFGLLTEDTLSSVLALRFATYLIVLPPLVGLLIIFGERTGLYDNYSWLALAVVSLMAIAIVLTWLNTKILYPIQLEHYMMKEALQFNNISLKLDATKLSKKVTELEKSKDEVVEKINHQDRLKTIIGDLG